MDKTDIAICIATYKRPYLLQQLLNSLNAIHLPESVSVSLRIVDNDTNETAKQTVAQFKKSTTSSFTEIHYLTESRQNIAHARNCAINLKPAHVIIFVDDDETVDKNWLIHLWQTYLTYKPDALFGPVKEKLTQANHKAWKEHFFSKSTPPTGTALTWQSTRTSNTLVDGNVFYGKNPLRFDSSFGISGGSDSHLFARLQKRGGILLACQEALVEEIVPPERATIAWLCKRWYRNGLIYERITTECDLERGGILRFTKRIIKSGLLCLKGVLHLGSSQNIYFHTALFEICLAWGGISAAFKPSTSKNHVAYKKESPV